MSNLEQEQSMEFLFENDEDRILAEPEFENADDDSFYEDGGDQSYGERFYEIASRESESSAAFESGVGEVLDDMEREFFWKKLGSSLKKFARKGVKALGKKAVEMAGGNLKGLLKNAAKMGLNSVVPGSGVALSALGFEAADDREAWDGFSGFSREAFENLADEIARNSESVNARNVGALTNIATRAFNQTLARTNGKAKSDTTRIKRITASKGDTIVIKFA